MAYPTPPPLSAFGPLVTQTARHWRRAVDRELQPHGLTEATWLPLIHLARAGEPMRQKDLAASLSLDGSSVVRLLDGLQSQGLIERREGSDRRAKAIHLTPRGQMTVDTVEGVARRVRDRALADVPKKDIATVFRVLNQVCDALSASVEHPA